MREITDEQIGALHEQAECLEDAGNVRDFARAIIAQHEAQRQAEPDLTVAYMAGLEDGKGRQAGQEQPTLCLSTVKRVATQLGWTPPGQAGQEPVAYMYHDASSAETANPLWDSTMLVFAADRKPHYRNETPLYAAPQQMRDYVVADRAQRQADPDLTIAYMSGLEDGKGRQAGPVPEGYRLVSVARLINWKAQANETAAKIIKAERYEAGIKLKQWIADVIKEAPQPAEPFSHLKATPEDMAIYRGIAQRQAGQEPVAWRYPQAQKDAEIAALRLAVETVCEGWTLPHDARKVLESALWPTMAQAVQP